MRVRAQHSRDARHCELGDKNTATPGGKLSSIACRRGVRHDATLVAVCLDVAVRRVYERAALRLDGRVRLRASLQVANDSLVRRHVR